MKQLDPKAVWLFFISNLMLFFVLLMFGGWAIGLPLAFMAKLLFGEDLIVVSVVVTGTILLMWILFSFVWAKLTYRFYKYELSEYVFKKEHGVIWKKYVSIPYDRIQNVDIYRGILARLLGLSDLHIQTAGSSYGRYPSTEGRLFGLSVADAEKLRDEILLKARQSKNQGL